MRSLAGLSASLHTPQTPNAFAAQFRSTIPPHSHLCQRVEDPSKKRGIEEENGEGERADGGLRRAVRFEKRAVLPQDEDEEEAPNGGNDTGAALVQRWPHDADAEADDKQQHARDGALERVERNRGEREQRSRAARWLPR